MITLDALIKWTKLIKDTLDKAKFVIDGVEVERSFFKLEASGTKITVLVYLTDTDIGKVEDLEVIAADGTVLIRKPDTIIKDQAEGYIVGFILELTGSEIG